MRDDYRVLSRGPLDGPWDLNRLQQDYINGNFNGLNMRFMHPAAFKSLDFLLRLETLQYLEINGRVNADSAAFKLPNLRELILLTRSSRRIPGFASSSLEMLGIDDRKGKENIAKLKHLHSLAIWLWKGIDLRFLGNRALSLRALRLEGKRQLATLDGIAVCRNLTELRIREARIESLAPLCGLKSLRSLQILPSIKSKGEAHLDLADLSPLTNLEELNLSYGGSIHSLRPLLDLPALRDIRLRGTRIIDGDLSPLDRLSPGAEIVGPDD